MCRATMRLCVMGKSDGHPLAALIVAGAKECVGAAFRPQGRGAEGLDCVGVVLVAAARAGISIPARSDYPLHGQGVGEATAELITRGFRLLNWDEVRPGDLLLTSRARRQVHFAVRTGEGLVEAHIGMRRVIERPMAEDDQWVSAWRIPLEG